QGSVKGNENVLRGSVGGDPQYALTIFRQSLQPVPRFAGRDDYQRFGVSPLFVFRGVINK
ncbi:sulfatase modifying factor 1, partial [Klebsiella pneumoniae]